MIKQIKITYNGVTQNDLGDSISLLIYTMDWRTECLKKAKRIEKTCLEFSKLYMYVGNIFDKRILYNFFSDNIQPLFGEFKKKYF